MARPKKIIISENLEQQLDVEETGLVYKQEEIIEKVVTIHDKYRDLINQVKDGYITDFTYPKAMEILRWVENKRGINLGLNMSCSICLMDLVKMFSSLETK